MPTMESPLSSPASPNVRRPASGFSAEETERILIHLDQLCASIEFVRSERMISFLRLVVAKALEGTPQDLNERLIGREVFERPSDWDPTIDTIVRSEARRLRAKLEQYYQSHAVKPVRIHVPKGGYIPEFVLEPLSVPVVAPAAPVRTDLRVLWAGAIMFSLLLVAGAALWSHQRRNEMRPFTIRPYTSELGEEYSPALSPDGKTVAYVWDGNTNQPDIYLSSVDGGQPRRLLPQAALRISPAWSPDGSQLAFLQLQEEQVMVMVYSFHAGAAKDVARVTRETGRWTDDAGLLLGNPGPAWTPDGAALIVADRNRQDSTGGLYRIWLDGRREQMTFTKGEEHDLYPRISPDGRQLAFARYTSHGDGDIFVMPTSGGAQRRITTDERAIQGIAWTRDSAGLIFGSNRRGSFQLWRSNLTGPEPQLIVTNSSNAADPALSTGNDWLMYVDSSQNWNIWHAALSDHVEGAMRLLSSSGRNYDPRYSPDGSKIAFISDRSGDMQLWLAESDGSGLRQITHFKGGWLGGISWSPDGLWIAFDGRPQGRSAIFVVSTQGGEPKLLESNSFEERMPAWGRDSKTLYFNSLRDGGMAIWKRSLADGHLERVSPHGMFAVASTPNGIFYSSRAGEVWQAGPNGENAHQVEGVQAFPVMSWFVAGNDLYFSRFSKETNSFELMQWDGSHLHSMGRLSADLVQNAPDIALSPDRQSILFAQEDLSNRDLKIRSPIR